MLLKPVYFLKKILLLEFIRTDLFLFFLSLFCCLFLSSVIFLLVYPKGKKVEDFVSHIKQYILNTPPDELFDFVVPLIIVFVLGFFLKTLMPSLIWVLVTVSYYSLEYAYREIRKSPRLENFNKEYSLILDLRENKFSYVEIALPLQMLALSMVYNECYPLLHDEDGDIDTYGHFAAGMGIFFVSAAINVCFEYFFLMRVEPKLGGLNFILIVLIYCARCLVTLLPGIHILSESYPGTQIANNYQRFMPFFGRGYGFESMEGAFIFQVFLDQLENCKDEDSRQAFIESMMRNDRIITDVAVLGFIVLNAGLLESVCYWDVYDNIRDFSADRGVVIPKTGSWNTVVPPEKILPSYWQEEEMLRSMRKK